MTNGQKKVGLHSLLCVFVCVGETESVKAWMREHVWGVCEMRNYINLCPVNPCQRMQCLPRFISNVKYESIQR